MNGFTRKFADFIADRIGERIAWLRINDSQYNEYCRKRSILLEREFIDLDECKKTMHEINELSNLISDIENSYLFIMGMRESKNIAEAIASQDFLNELLHGNGTE